MVQDVSSCLAQLTRGLLRHGEHRTAQHLGDRSTYVGLSDVGRAITCLRAAVAAKLGRGEHAGADDIAGWLCGGDNGPILETLRRQLILQRGHWLEWGIESALRANRGLVLTQLEIAPPGHVPIRAPRDFVVLKGGDQPALRVLETKSTGHLPRTLHPGYEAQLYGQVGMLTEFWSRPVFSIKDGNGRSVANGQTFPDLCFRLLGLSIPDDPSAVDIDGWILCLSMSDARAVGPYRPHAAMTALCYRTAEQLWTTVQAAKAGRVALADIEICRGFHPLCDWCDHADGCPKFTATPLNDPVLDDTLAELAQLKADKAGLDADIEVREERIRQFCSRSNRDPGWLSTPRFRFKTARVPGRQSIDSARLRSELTNRIGESEADALITRLTTQGDPYDRLTVSPRKSSPG